MQPGVRTVLFQFFPFLSEFNFLYFCFCFFVSCCSRINAIWTVLKVEAIALVTRRWQASDQKAILEVMVVNRDGIFQVSKTRWPLYREGDFTSRGVLLQDCLTSYISLRWRLTGSIRCFTTGMVELATRHKARSYACGRRLKRRVLQ